MAVNGVEIKISELNPLRYIQVNKIDYNYITSNFVNTLFTSPTNPFKYIQRFGIGDLARTQFCTIGEFTLGEEVWFLTAKLMNSVNEEVRTITVTEKTGSFNNGDLRVFEIEDELTGEGYYYVAIEFKHVLSGVTKIAQFASEPFIVEASANCLPKIVYTDSKNYPNYYLFFATGIVFQMRAEVLLNQLPKVDLINYRNNIDTTENLHRRFYYNYELITYRLAPVWIASKLKFALSLSNCYVNFEPFMLTADDDIELIEDGLNACTFKFKLNSNGDKLIINGDDLTADETEFTKNFTNLECGGDLSIACPPFSPTCPSSDSAFEQWLSNNPTSGTNTGDQDLSGYLLKDTTLQTAETPTDTSLFSFWKIGVGRVKITWLNLIAKLNDYFTAKHEHTHTELLALCSANALKIGDLYLLTDYETTYTQPVTGIDMSSGVIEPLLLKASSVNTFETICSSALYPRDIISYDINDSSEGFTKGKIFRRNDTINSIDAGTDWRHVKYRRWELNVTTQWVQGSNYTIGDIVTTGYDIYVCSKTHTNSGDVNTNFIHYPFGNGDFAGLDSTGQQINIGGNGYSIPVSSNFEDRLKFGSDCHYHKWDGEILDNIVIGDSNSYLTIGDGNDSLTIGNSNGYLTIGDGNDSLTIGDSNGSLTVGDSNGSLTISDNNGSLTIKNRNSYLTIGDGNDSLTIGNSNGYLTINDNNDSLTIGNNNGSLTVSDSNGSLTIGDRNSYLTIGDGNDSLTIGNSNGSLTVGDLFHNYEIKNNTSNIIPTNISADYLKTIYKAGTKQLLEYTDEFGDVNQIEL